MKQLRYLFIAAPAVFMIATSVFAHRGHDTLSVVEIQMQTGAVTVTHHLVAHDVEPALKQIAPGAQASLDDPTAVKALTAYVAGRFSLAESSGAVTLQLKDVKLSGDDVQLIYTGRMLAAGSELRVRSRILTDVYSDQHNQVNVRRAGVTRTLNFNGASEAQVLPPVSAGQ